MNAKDGDLLDVGFHGAAVTVEASPDGCRIGAGEEPYAENVGSL